VAGREEGLQGQDGRLVEGVGNDDLISGGVEGEADGDFAAVEECCDAVADGVFTERLEG
jgi:hypothetical protein